MISPVFIFYISWTQNHFEWVGNCAFNFFPSKGVISSGSEPCTFASKHIKISAALPKQLIRANHYSPSNSMCNAKQIS